ncbi:MAG TPA: hypothetical protein VHW43_11820 [Puia sp.]|nr:hypothetical protein [Puia sp.]
MQSKTILTVACFTALHTLARAQDESTEKDVLTIYKGAHSYKEVSVAGKTTEVYVDEKRVADSEAPHYDSLIQVMRTDVDDDDRRFARMDEKMERDEERTEEQRERVQAKFDRIRAKSDRIRAKSDRVQAKEKRAAMRDQ